MWARGTSNCRTRGAVYLVRLRRAALPRHPRVPSVAGALCGNGRAVGWEWLGEQPPRDLEAEATRNGWKFSVRLPGIAYWSNTDTILISHDVLLSIWPLFLLTAILPSLWTVRCLSRRRRQSNQR